MSTMQHRDRSVLDQPRRHQEAIAARLNGEGEHRILPHNIDAERALLGAVMVNNDAFRRVVSELKDFDASCFMEAVHQRMWESIVGLIESGRIANPIILKGYLGDNDIGGTTPFEYLVRLSAEATTVLNAPDYARTVRDLALRRRLIRLTTDLCDLAYECPVEMTAEAIWSELERDLETERPLMTGAASDFRDFGNISSQDVFDAYQRQTGLVGLSTGLPRLDDVLGGLQASDLIIIAGRPGSGKTALSTNIAVAVSRHVMARAKEGERLGVVGFSSLEMGERQLKQRILSDLSSVPFWKLKRGIADRHEMERYIDAEREFQKLPLMIDPTGGLSIAQLKMRARALKKRRGLSLLVVDYLQLLSGTGRKDNRVAEVTEITTGLKALAKELDVPIIALSQLSRKVEERDDKRPMLSDLRESGSIEQDADSVVFIYREEYYLRKMEPREEGSDAHLRWQGQMRRWAGIAEAIVAKNRHGSEGTVQIGFRGEFTRFTNEPDEREIEPEEVRQRAAKKPIFTAEGTILYGILKSLTLTRSTLATQEQREADRKLCRGARLIPLDEARNAFGQQVMPGESEEKVKTRFRSAFLSLRKHEIAHYHGTEETGFWVWLPEQVADV